MPAETVRDFVPRAIERRIDLGYEGPETHDATRLRAFSLEEAKPLRDQITGANMAMDGGWTAE